MLGKINKREVKENEKKKKQKKKSQSCCENEENRLGTFKRRT